MRVDNYWLELSKMDVEEK